MAINRVLRRRLRTSDIQELLCGPQLDTLPEDPACREVLLRQVAVNKRTLTDMMGSIISKKEVEERERQRDN